MRTKNKLEMFCGNEFSLRTFLYQHNFKFSRLIKGRVPLTYIAYYEFLKYMQTHTYLHVQILRTQVWVFPLAAKKFC